MDNLFQETLAMMVRTFAILEEQVPQPRPEPFSEGYVYRYAEKSARQALLSKACEGRKWAACGSDSSGTWLLSGTGVPATDVV